MKKLLIALSFCFLFLSNANAQLAGLRTRSPKASSLLDMDVSALPAGSKKGFLMTRVALNSATDVSTIISPKVGLWVYNTQTTSGANPVKANCIYMWNGTVWEAYSSSNDVQVRLSPDDFFMKSPTDYLMSGLTLTSFNSSLLLIPVPWETSSIAITNPTYITLNGDLQTFTVNKSGSYDISGFLNYNPVISSTSSKTALRLVFQVLKFGVWTDVTTVNSTFEQMAANTVQTITIPFDVVKLDAGNQFRFVITKPIGSSTNTNHGTNAGITSVTGDLRKSFRISFIN